MCLLLFLSGLLFSTCATRVEASDIPYPSEPNQEVPAIDVTSPSQGEVFIITSVILNFTVTKPVSWNVYWLTTIPVIGAYAVDVYLDGNRRGTLLDPGSSGFPNATYAVLLDRLARGSHNVTLVLESSTYYSNPSPEPADFLTFSRNFTEAIGFTVNADLPTSTPSLSPKPTLKPESFPTVPFLIILVMVVVLATAGLLVYFNKRRNNER